jgi:sugar phosphate isomerase/epimerase
MDFGISTRCFGTAPVTLDVLERLRRAEFSIIELHAALPGFPYRNRSVLRGIARWFGENKLPAPSLHLPFEDDAISIQPLERQRALDNIKRCLELAEFLPLSYTVLHLGIAGQKFNPVFLDHAYKAVSTIQAFSGVRVLIETLPNEIAAFDRIREFRGVAQIPDLGICYDTGHGEMEGPADAIHLDDGRAGIDEHLWPFEGDRNWPALVERIVSLSFEGRMILEGHDDRLDKAFDGISRLRDLIDEARSSIEEFRLKYKLPAPRQEDEE